MSMPSENATGLVVMDVVVNGIREVCRRRTHDGQIRPDLGPDGRMTGTLTNGQNSTPVDSSARARQRWN